jgi:hypothetical protein
VKKCVDPYDSKFIVIKFSQVFESDFGVTFTVSNSAYPEKIFGQ